MKRIALSAAASGLLRALLRRAGTDQDRILLTEFRSVDWRSLTFEGERHEIGLKVLAPGAESLAAALTRDLDEAEFHLPRQIVADIQVAGAFRRNADGSIDLAIEALTIAE